MASQRSPLVRFTDGSDASTTGTTIPSAPKPAAIADKQQERIFGLEEVLQEDAQKNRGLFNDTLEDLRAQFVRFLMTNNAEAGGYERADWKFIVYEKQVRGQFKKLAFDAFKQELREKNYAWKETYDADDDDSGAYHFCLPSHMLEFHGL